MHWLIEKTGENSEKPEKKIAQGGAQSAMFVYSLACANFRPQMSSRLKSKMKFGYPGLGYI